MMKEKRGKSLPLFFILKTKNYPNEFFLVEGNFFRIVEYSNINIGG
ncbi:hypothetical protein J2S10_000050 [Neobacillus ginsengisoli]|uniref:Uncharacterized protein n=1 Tax=Neobacillus ginsengisoli TaxID=904295 RepID=A0ABT9XN32_9BACI|nr:hypothetical protein [Neobacillus ginsengisoli]